MLQLLNKNKFLIVTILIGLSTAIIFFLVTQNKIKSDVVFKSGVKNSTEWVIRKYKDCTDCPEINMVQLPQGSFLMGSELEGYSNEYPPHMVEVNYDFEIGMFEVTQSQWVRIMGPYKNYFQDCSKDTLGQCPIESVDFNQVQTFIKRLNELTKKQYRLPTEAEWEYACRAGQQFSYCGHNSPEVVGWFLSNSYSDKYKYFTTHKVGLKQPNRWGLHDMSGNVWEWVQDNWHDNYKGAPTNAKLAWINHGNTDTHVLRGGAWDADPNFTRATNRIGLDDTMKLSYFGFRLARTLSK